MATNEKLTRHEVCIKAVREIAAANIRGFRPTTMEALLQEVEQDKEGRGFSAHWAWSWAVEAHLDVYFDQSIPEGKKGPVVYTPRLRVNWPAGARSPIDAQVSLQLYQLVTDLACRLEVLLRPYVITE